MSLLARDLVDRLVGVIDLQAGRAVAAVGGHRHRYRPLSFGVSSCAATACDGSPDHLADHYRRLGLGSLYLADLDALGGGAIQWPALESLLSRCGGLREVLIDAGWRGSESAADARAITRVSERYAALRWIVATESARDAGALGRLCEMISPQRVLLGLDYRGGEFQSCWGDEAEWLEAAQEHSLGGAVLLDIAAVGSRRGAATEAACRRVRKHWSDAELYSGGGIRSGDDARALLAAGCDRCLVATALHPAVG